MPKTLLPAEVAQHAIETASDGVYWIDFAGRFVYVNDAACHALGYTREELLTLIVSDIDPNYPPEALPDQWARVRRSRSLVMESLHKTKDGRIYPVELSINLVTYWDRDYHCVFSRDISARKKVEQALRKSEEQYRMVVDQARDVILVAQDGLIKFVNQRAEELSGRGVKAIVGTPIGDWIHVEDRQLVQDNHQKRLQGENLPDEYNIRYLNRDRSVGWMTLRVRPITWEDRPATLSVLTDVTPRVRAEEALKTSEEYYRAMFQASRDAVFITNQGGRIIDYNQAACELTGYTPDELEQTPAYALYADPKERDDLVAKVGANGFAKDVEVKVRRKDGTVVVCLNTAVVMPIGGELRAVSTIRDITERKQVEKELAEHRTNLAELVTARTAELEALNYDLQREISERGRMEHELLLHQRKLGQMGSDLVITEEKERRRIAAGLHDQIGQYLATANMKLKTLKRDLGPTHQETLDDILELVDAMIREIRSLTLELSPPILYELGLVQAVEWLTEQIQERHGLKTEFRDDGRPKPMSDDIRVFLFRAVRELLMNVVKHARASQARVQMWVDDGYIKIEVQDDGIGLDPEVLREGSTMGQGFGLFSIRERLTPLGGFLKIDSQPHQGTRATLMAPQKQTG
jgi:PAS domain S-box-containing protein